MNFLPMNQLGPHLTGSLVNFGILLPDIDPLSFGLEVRVIHEKDQFIQTEPPFVQAMAHLTHPVYGDYWHTTVDLSRAGSGIHWGTPGKYLYRYCLLLKNGTKVDWVIDPYAREFGTGRHAAFTYGYEDYTWSAHENAWKVPAHHDLILYELNIFEFAGSLPQATDRLDYLADLGINCISLMPVTNISDAIDWGYTPIGYFGVDERFGNRYNFQEFVDNAHQRKIAVLVDAIYGHTNSLFGYKYLYDNAGVANPFMGHFSQDMFAPSVDWSKALPQDFFFSVNRHWLETYHVDGFRYDCVPNYWELGPQFRGYADIAYSTFKHVKSEIADNNPLYKRFDDGNSPVRIIQCAEQLEAVKDVLEQTYSTCCWQNTTKSEAEKVANGVPGAISDFGKALGAFNLPTEGTINGDTLFKSPLQYIENHDHNRFICNFGTLNPDDGGNELFEQGNRENWFKVQPYLMGLLMAKGIPLLWQGQELCENSKITPGGMSRTGFLRIVHWEYFYDSMGKGTLNLVRRLMKIRKNNLQIRDGEHFYFGNDELYANNGILIFARYYPNTNLYTLVALNFTSQDKSVPFWFPLSGAFREELHGNADPSLNLAGVVAFQEYFIHIPSNYGRIWTHA